jgi:hypothetical protein
VAFDEFDENIDQELTEVFSGMRAPAHLASSVMRRVRVPAPSRLPEFLDAIGWVGVLAFATGFAFFVILK